jgi:Spy/CpxP family protein refolding chaperone
MKTTHILGIVLTGATLAMATTAAQAEPLDIKPGLWQMTVRGEMHGMPPIPEEQLKGMSPQQRAAIEKMMAESAKPHTRIIKQCITQEDLNKSEDLFTSDQPGMKCENKLSKHSSTGMTGTIDCTKDGTRTTGDYSYVAKDREHVTGKVSMTISNGRNTMTTTGTMSGQWLGAECDKND